MKMIHKKSALITSIIAATATAAVQAQQVQELEEILVTVQRKETSAWDTPASIEVLDGEDIAVLQPNSLADLVRYQPEISFEQSNDRRGAGSFVIRGLSGNRVIMLIDGTRLPDGFGSGGVTNGRNSFEPYSMGNIQFLKGPSSALYGSDALAGVVLLNTMSPQQLLQGSDGPIVEFSGGYDEVNDGYRQTLTFASKAFGGDFFVQAATRQTSETDIHGSPENFPMDADQRNILMKWENNNNADNQWGFLGDFWQRDVDANFNSGLSPTSSVVDSRTEDSSDRWRLGFFQSLTDFASIDRIDWQIDLQEANVAEDEFQTSLDGAESILDFEEVDINQDLISFSVLLGEQMGNHDVMAGIDYTQKSSERINYYRDINLGTGEIDPTRNGVTYPARSYPVSDTDLLGIFVQDEISLMEDRLSLTLGLRYDYFNNEPSPDQLYFNSNPTGINVEGESSDQFSPSVGLTYEISNGALLFANYTSGFRSPPISSQYINTFIQSRGFPHEILANPNLKSESSDGIEGGLRLRGATGNLEISVYRTDYEDFIESTRAGTRPNPAPGFRPVTQIQYQNLSEVEISGVEVDAELDLQNLLNTTDQWWLTLNYANLDGDNKLSDEPLTSVGPSQAVVGLRYQAAGGNFGAQLNARFMDEFDDVAPGTFAIPDYTRVDLSAYYDFSEQFSINVRIDNLSDEQYWYQHVAGSSSRTFSADEAAAPGRTFSVSVRYRFGL